MKTFIFLMLLLCVKNSLTTDTRCEELNDNDNECTETDYDSYMTCMRSRRMKRNACGETCQDSSCEQSCTDCDCNTCSADSCSSTCNKCCANFEQPCTNQHCCYKSCHSSCASTDCRRSCRKSCGDKMNGARIEIHGSNSTQLHNITTVINIRNVINNTNLIDIPVNVNNTNINNITVELQGGGGSSSYINSSRITDSSRCCHIISPRHCFPTSTYPFVRCAHYRKHTCNNICTAPTMHAQPHQVCDERPSGPPSCHQQIIYIPQPQPRCVSQSTWPYVSCGLQNTDYCYGCYSHYASGGRPPSRCSPSCYNDGYGVGPYYRQGPFYRQDYAPTPSCLQMGTCNFGEFQGTGQYINQGYSDIPLNQLGYPPAMYENSYSVEVDPAAELNLNSSGNYDVSELRIPSNQLPQLDDIPNLVKIETTKYPQSKDRDASVTITKSDDVEAVDEDVLVQ